MVFSGELPKISEALTLLDHVNRALTTSTGPAGPQRGLCYTGFMKQEMDIVRAATEKDKRLICLMIKSWSDECPNELTAASSSHAKDLTPTARSRTLATVSAEAEQEADL